MIKVFTCGCFDVLHVGHVELLRRAKELGDELIVAVNTNESVKRLKGPSRPINTLLSRIKVLEAIRWVDKVVWFDDPNPSRIVGIIRPDIVVKGPGYSRENMPEAAVVESYGGKVVILDGPEISTTGIINKIRKEECRG